MPVIYFCIHTSPHVQTHIQKDTTHIGTCKQTSMRKALAWKAGQTSRFRLHTKRRIQVQYMGHLF